MSDCIDFVYETSEDLKQFENLFERLLIATKQVLNIKQNLYFSVNFINKNKSIFLNNKYRNKNYVGDVISFPINDEFGIYDQLDFKEIGDIFITYEEAIEKSKKYNHSINAEMAWLFVHGLLHILGYDHETNEKEALYMFSLTDEILLKENIIYTME